VQKQETDFDIETNVPVNLAVALELARNGDAQAEQMIRSNTTTDYLERAYKSGFISEVTLDRRADGELIQYGQKIEDVHVNSLQFMNNEKLKERAKVEALNSVRDKYYANNGMFKDKARVVFSLVHEEMDDTEASEAGFFTHTRSLSIQLMTEKEGVLVIQSAFVAGRENLSDSAFDKQAVILLARKLGIDYEGQTTEEILCRPLLIDKKLLPNLSATLVEMFDEAATEVTGKQKFFGLDSDIKPTRIAYIEKEAQSKQIATDMQTHIYSVVERLKALRFTSPIEATNKLAEFNEDLLKQRIILDETIDARVLGVEANYYINHARSLIFSGVITQQQLHRDLSALQSQINRTGSSSSCPGGANNKLDKLGRDIFGILEESRDNKEEQDSSIPKDCEFVSKECPKCGAKDVKTECKKGIYYGACGCSSK
jgi:hypothetical protein